MRSTRYANSFRAAKMRSTRYAKTSRQARMRIVRYTTHSFGKTRRLRYATHSIRPTRSLRYANLNQMQRNMRNAYTSRSAITRNMRYANLIEPTTRRFCWPTRRSRNAAHSTAIEQVRQNVI